MTTIITNIYKVNSKYGKMFNCENIQINNLKMINSIEYTIYVYKDLYLYIDKDNHKQCFRYKNINHTLKDNYLIEKVEEIVMHLANFPFINNYDKIYKKKIVTYKDNNNNEFNLVLEKSNVDISYLSFKNDIDANKIIKFIV